MTAIILFGTMIVLLIIGVPISVSLGAATMASLLCFDVPMAVVPQRMFTALDSVSIMAIPLFCTGGKSYDRRWNIPPSGGFLQQYYR